MAEIVMHLFDRTLFRRLRSSAIVHNAFAMLGTQIATYAFPLATIPYLARVLGPVHWGLVAFAQALGLYLSMVVEFGFNLSATRRIARSRDDMGQVEQIVAGVMGAKVLLAIVCLAAMLLAQQLVPSFQQNRTIVWAGALSGIGQGFSMLWFYQGMERMKAPAAMDMLGKAVAAAGIFMFVHSRRDAWRVLGLQCLCYWGVTLILLAITYRKIGFRWPNMQTIRRSLRDSAAMFLFRSSVSLYTTANALILGAVSTPVAVGFYSGAERLVKALANLLNPLTQSLYPRVSRLLATDSSRAVSLARLSLIVTGSVGLGFCALTFAAAPLITRVVLGPGYGPAIPVMRVLSLLLPAIAVSTVLGIQWMLPLGMDGVYNKIILSAGFLNLALALCWATRWQQMGMACAVVVSEYVVTIGVCIVLVRRKISPFNEVAALQFRLQEQLAAVDPS
jgi:PST family polysaccharide transporter